MRTLWRRTIPRDFRRRIAGMAAALLPAMVCSLAQGQGTKFSAFNLIAGNKGNGSSTLTLDITVKQPTAIRSITIPQGFAGRSEFVLTGQSGCVVDGTTINPANTVCHISIFFLPQKAGQRSATVIVTDGDGVPQAFGVSGFGYFPLLQMTPSAAKTVAGLGSANQGSSGDGGAAILAALSGPTGIVGDSFGNVYFSDTANNRVRMIDPFGNITTVAGGGAVAGGAADGGPATAAKLVQPTYLSVDLAGNLFISETGSHVVRRVAMSTNRIITTVAGNYTAGFIDNTLATSAELNAPTGIAVDIFENLYIADNGNHRLREVSVADGTISTIAGSGTVGQDSGNVNALSAKFSSSMGGVAAYRGAHIYVADTGNHMVRGMFTLSAVLDVVAGTGVSGNSGDGGSAQSATLMSPVDIATDPVGDLYIADSAAGVVRKVESFSGLIETVAGDTSQRGSFSSSVGPSTSLALYQTHGIGFDANWNLYIADTFNNAVREIPSLPGELSFAALTAGNTSAPLKMQVANIGTAQTDITAVSPANAASSANFAPSNAGAGSCGLALHTGAHCEFSVSFTPQTNGFLFGELDVLHTLDSGGTAHEPVYLLGGDLTPLTIGPEALANATPNTPYNAAITITGGVGTVSVEHVDTLPTGITSSLNGTTLTLNGTPTVQGSFSISVFATDTLGEDVAKTYSLIVALPLLTLTDNESIGVVDTVSPLPGLVLTTQESIGVVDSVSPLPGLVLTTQEAIAVQDASAALPGLVLTVTESVGVVDAVAVKGPQTITAPSISGHTYGDAPFSVAATSSSGLPVSVAATGAVTLNGQMLTINGAGPVTLTYTQAGDADYSAAAPQTVNFIIARAPATLKAGNATRVFGAPNPAFTFTAGPFVNGDTLASLGGEPSFSTTAKINSPAGDYPILISVGTLPTQNYFFTTVGGTLTITGSVAQSISFLPLPNIPRHFSPLTLTAHSSSGLPVTYSVTGPATLNQNQLILTGAGKVTVTASQNGNATFSAATPVIRSFTVTP